MQALPTGFRGTLWPATATLDRLTHFFVIFLVVFVIIIVVVVIFLFFIRWGIVLGGYIAQVRYCGLFRGYDLEDDVFLEVILELLAQQERILISAGIRTIENLCVMKYLWIVSIGCLVTRECAETPSAYQCKIAHKGPEVTIIFCLQLCLDGTQCDWLCDDIVVARNESLVDFLVEGLGGVVFTGLC